MITTLLAWIQPITVIAFILSGLFCLLLGDKQYGIINLALSVANFFLFYGKAVFK